MMALRLPARFGSDAAAARRWRDALLFEHRIEVQVGAWRERLWLRVSVQVYNEIDDFERLASAIDAVSSGNAV